MAEFAVLRQCVPLPAVLFEGQFSAAQTQFAAAPELYASGAVRTALAEAVGTGPCPYACEVTGPLLVDLGGAVFLTIAPVRHEGALYINERLRALARLAARTLGGHRAMPALPTGPRFPGTEQGRLQAAWRRTLRVVRAAMDVGTWLMPVRLTPRLTPEDVLVSADARWMVPNRAAGMPTVPWADLVATVARQRGISRAAALRRILRELALNRRRWKLTVHPWLGRYVDVAYRALLLVPVSGVIAGVLFSPTMVRHYPSVVEFWGVLEGATDLVMRALAAAAARVAALLGAGLDPDAALRAGGGAVERAQAFYMRFVRHLLNLPWLMFWPMLLGAAVNLRFGALERYQRGFLERLARASRELTIFMNQLTALVSATVHSSFFQLIPYVLQFIACAGRVVQGLFSYLWSIAGRRDESEQPLVELDVSGGAPRFASRALALADEYWRDLGGAWAVELAAVAGALKERLANRFAYAAIGGFMQNAVLDVTDSFMAIAARDYAAGAVSAFYEYAHAIRLHVVMARDWRALNAPSPTAAVDALFVDFVAPYMATGGMLFTFCRHILGVMAPGSPLWNLLGVSDTTIVTQLVENVFPTDNLADNAAQRLAAELAGLPSAEPEAERLRLAEYRDFIRTLRATTTVRPVAEQHTNLGATAECTAALFSSMAALSTAFGIGGSAEDAGRAAAAREAAGMISSALSNNAYRVLRERIGYDYADGEFLDKWTWRAAYAMTHRTSYFGDAWRFLLGIYQTPEQAHMGADELARRRAEREAGALTFDQRLIPAPQVVETIFHFRYGGRASDWLLRPAAAAGGWTMRAATAALLELRPAWGALALPAAVLVSEIVAPDAVAFVALQIGSRALLALLGGRRDPGLETVTGSRSGPSMRVVNFVRDVWRRAAAAVANLPSTGLLRALRAAAEAVGRALGAFVNYVIDKFGAAAGIFVETAVVDALRIGYDVFADYMNQRIIVTALISVVLFFLGDIEWVAAAAAFAEPLLLYGSCLLRLFWAGRDASAFAPLAPGEESVLPGEQRSDRPLRQYLLALHMGGRTVEWKARRVDFTAVKLHAE